MPIRIRLGQEEVQVEPGGSAQLVAIIRNEGDQPDEVAIEVEGIATEWCAIPIPSFRVEPGQEVQERILIRPPRSAESRAGTYPLIVRARSLENGASGVAQASLTIRPYSMLALELSPRRGVATPLFQKRVAYELNVSNYGNSEQTVQLQASDPEDELVFELERERLPLAPGETQPVMLYAQPRRLPLLANPALYSFTVTARSVEDHMRSTSAQAHLERRGLINPTVLVFLALLIALAGIWYYTRPLPVEIEEFTAEPTQIVAGEKSLLRWSVRNADSLRIEPNVGNLEPNQRSVEVQPTNTTTYRLIARNRYGEVTREAVVIVQNAPPPPPPQITQFIADPPQIRLGESVYLRWKVENATELILSPPGQKLDPLTPGFEHRPSRTTEYILVARNAEGKTHEAKVRVEVIDPSLAQIVQFTVQPERIQAGEIATLRWEVENAVRAEIDNGIGRVEVPKGEFSVTPTQTTVYTLTAYDQQGRPARAKVTLTVVNDPSATTPNPTDTTP